MGADKKCHLAKRAAVRQLGSFWQRNCRADLYLREIRSIGYSRHLSDTQSETDNHRDPGHSRQSCDIRKRRHQCKGA